MAICTCTHRKEIGINSEYLVKFLMKFNVNDINCFTLAPQVSAKVMMVIMIEWLISQLKSSSYIHYTSYGLGFGSLDCDWAVWFLLQQGLIEDPCWILRAGPLPGFQWKIVTKTQTETGGVECFWPSLKWARWWWWWWWWCLTCTWCQHGSIWPYTTGPVENVCCSRCQKQNLALCSVCSLRFCESTPWNANW